MPGVTGFPGALDTLPNSYGDASDAKTGTPTGGTTGAHAQHHDDMAAAINAVEAALGINPQGLYAASVRERFEISAYKNQSVKFATTANLAATYANGTAGVGATLTANPSAVAPTTDGITWVVGDRVLVKNQTTPAQNGIYTVTQITSPWILTRALDANTSAKIADCRVLVDQGSLQPFAQGDTEWACVTTAPVVGTDPLYWRRTMPFYGHGNPRSPWAMGADTTQAVFESLPRVLASASAAIPTGTCYMMGGITVPAGRTISTINYRVQTIPTAAPTVDWVGLTNMSRSVLATSANNLTSWAAAPTDRSRALTTPWTPVEDTSIYVMIALTATGGATLVGGPTAASPSTSFARAPILAGTTTVPTSTPPTNGTAMTAISAGSVLPYVWLT